MKRNPLIYKLVSLLILFFLLGSACSVPEAQTTHLNSYIPSSASQPAEEMTALNAGIVCENLEGNFLTCDDNQLHSLCELVYDSLFIKTDADSYETNIVKTFETTKKEDTVTLWSFSIRTDISFSSSGKKLTAKDCVDTINYIKSNGGYYADSLSGIIVCTQTSPYSFDIECNSDSDELIKTLVFPILSSESLGSQPSILKTEGSGVYTVSAFDSESDLLCLTRNELSWKKPAMFTEMHIRICSSNDELYKLYENDAVDFAVFSSDFGFPAVASSDTTTLLNPGDMVKLLELNESSGFLSSSDLRKAILTAVNRDQLARLIQPSQAIEINRVQGTCIKDTKNSFVYEFDLQQSKKSFESFLAQNPDISPEELCLEIIIESQQDNKTDYNIALFIQNDLNRTGIMTNVHSLTHDEFQSALAQKRYDIAIRSCPVADYSSIRYYEDLGIYSPSDYIDASVDSENTMFQSSETLEQIERMLYAQQCILPLYQDADCVLYRNLVLNALVTGSDHSFSILNR